MANSAEFRRTETNITDLRAAVARMGFNMVRSIAVAFAMRQLRRKDTYSATAQLQLEQAWEESLATSATCFVIAKRFTRLNPDQALLVGLLHILGRLYIIMRSKDAPELSDVEMRQVIESWHASIGKAILESWGLPEALQHAVEHQDALEVEHEGNVSMTDVLLAAKLLAKGETDGVKFPALRRVGVAAKDGASPMAAYEDEVNSVRASLSE
jgi:HD-like signal output (HDOD) protein